jgi:hypothetical protein
MEAARHPANAHTLSGGLSLVRFEASSVCFETANLVCVETASFVCFEGARL